MPSEINARKVLEEAGAQITALRRRIAVAKAREDILEFGKLWMPDAQGIRNGDPLATRYKPKPIHALIARYLTDLEAGRKKRMALSVPPQFGKSQLASIFFIAWSIGRDPTLSILFATYNEDLARAVGRKVKAILEHPMFRELFPTFELRSDQKSSEEIGTTLGGTISFLGRGGSGTGKPCDLQIIDDPLKNRTEAKSDKILAELWEWYTDVMNTRCHDGTRRLIIHTRWTTDDLIGRLCDPTHEGYNPGIAMEWDYINIPAVVTDPLLAAELGLVLETPTDRLVIEQFGEKPMASLWPKDPTEGPKARSFSLPYLASQKRISARTFEALYQGNPSPDDGTLFLREYLVGYSSPADIPKRLLKYGASDHALKETREGDPALVGCIGVDDQDHWWVLPDLAWDHFGPERLPQQIIAKIATHRPVYWFGENDMIGQTLGPTIRKLMDDTQTYCTMIPVPIQNDKEAKCAGAVARASLRKIHFPTFAPWWPKAKVELLKFPYAPHDEFPDFLGILARGLDYIRRPSRERKPDPGPPEIITMGWVRAAADRQKKLAAREKNCV